jgi:Ulp1 family protease
VVTVNIANGKVRSIDTLDRDHTSVVARILEFFVDHWKEIGGSRRLPRWRVKLLTPPKSPKQSDNNNCGIYACVIMDLYCGGIKIKNFKHIINERNIAEVRRRLGYFMTGFYYM